MQQQQYKVNDRVFDNIQEASEYVTTLSKPATIAPHTPPSKANVKLNVVRNMLVREMLEWAGSFVHDMTPSTDVNWMYSFEADSDWSDSGDTYYEDLENVTFGSNQVWHDDLDDYEGACANYSCLLGDYNCYDTVDSLSEMLNTMYHTMSDHSSETDSYCGAVRSSIKLLCEGNPNISHSYDEPSRTTTISFSGCVDSMYSAYMHERNS